MMLRPQCQKQGALRHILAAHDIAASGVVLPHCLCLGTHAHMLSSIGSIPKACVLARHLARPIIVECSQVSADVQAALQLH